ncbi:Hypp5326 [Branchiostoma lanceolatum]|uniref:Hypp5326 protein n=1 Tax=Branchiostoma lanceolatum TaxID=7740 RepID=A0A8K0AJD2_BRALA|nr:Hypp5326 [Branchiostoma lanceolatum]
MMKECLPGPPRVITKRKLWGHHIHSLRDNIPIVFKIVPISSGDEDDPVIVRMERVDPEPDLEEEDTSADTTHIMMDAEHSNAEPPERHDRRRRDTTDATWPQGMATWCSLYRSWWRSRRTRLRIPVWWRRCARLVCPVAAWALAVPVVEAIKKDPVADSRLVCPVAAWALAVPVVVVAVKEDPVEVPEEEGGVHVHVARLPTEVPVVVAVKEDPVADSRLVSPVAAWALAAPVVVAVKVDPVADSRLAAEEMAVEVPEEEGGVHVHVEVARLATEE